ISWYPVWGTRNLVVTENWLTQNPASLSAKEGERVEIMCGYSTTYSSFALDWYQELPGKAPTFLLRRYSDGSEYKLSSVSSRFSSQLDAGAKSFTLSIDGAQLADSAVYFCALRETTALQTALGPLHKPSVSIMKSENESIAACLVNDFYPKELKIVMNPDSQTIYEATDPILTSNGKYSAVKYIWSFKCHKFRTTLSNLYSC
uniref:Ig-like domain-containing protein n=1 Tax=Pelusios castaneus TaxID=367368 RepID=A0A8C8RR61_9SAUR